MAMKNGNGVLNSYKATEKAALAEEDSKVVKTAKLTYFQFMATKAFTDGTDIATRNNTISGLWSWLTTSEALGITCALNDLPRFLQQKIGPLV